MRLVTCPEIEQEYYELGSKPSVRALFDRRGIDPSELDFMIRDLLLISKRVTLVGTAPSCRDEDDRKYLHCALIGGASWLITRDPDLLVLDTVGQAVVTTPEEFLLAAGGLGIALDG